MKLATFALSGVSSRQRIGAVIGASIIDLQEAEIREGLPCQEFRSMLDLITGGERALDAARRRVERHHDAVLPLADVTLLAPIPQPPQIRDFLSFELHMRAASTAIARLRARGGPDPEAEAAIVAGGLRPAPPVWYEQPIYYKCNRFATAGADTTIQWPDYSELIDYELEIAAVIGRGGADISAARAGEHVFGYTIFNDFTARDAQIKEMGGPLGPAKGKDFDGANIFGPWIVTADDLDVGDLGMRAYVNGELWSEGSTATMRWSFGEMIAHVSRSETLHPGEILGSGTVGGGCGLESLRFLGDGDEVVLEIDGIGRLANRIHAPHVPKPA